MAFQRVAVIGAGAWGTALANVAARAGCDVTLIGREAATAAAIDKTRQNPQLPGVMIERRIAVGADKSIAAGADAVLMAVPAQSMRAGLDALALRAGTPVIACAKGIEQGSGLAMTEVIGTVLPAVQPGILSGPSFAADVG